MYFLSDINTFQVSDKLKSNSLQRASIAYKFVSLKGLHIVRKDNQGLLQKILEGLLIEIIGGWLYTNCID